VRLLRQPEKQTHHKTTAALRFQAALIRAKQRFSTKNPADFIKFRFAVL